jgi:hypothetical protein
MTDWTIPVRGRRWQIQELAEDEHYETRDTPQAWLSPDADGVTHIRADDGVLLTTLDPGEKRAFCYYEPRDSMTIRVFPDGSYTGAAERDRATIDMFDPAPQPSAVPPATVGGDPANFFMLSDDSEFQAWSLDEFARDWADFDKPLPEGGEVVEIDTAFVSDQIWLQVSADGRSLFPCDPPPSPPPEVF